MIHPYRIDQAQKESAETSPNAGKRREFATGSVRDDRTGKGRFDLISPIALRRLALHLENGAAKYGDRNWEKGQPLSCFLDSAYRHITKFLEGDRTEDHLAAGVWNLMACIHTEEMVRRNALDKTLNDLPDYTRRAAASVPGSNCNATSSRDSHCQVGTSSMDSFHVGREHARTPTAQELAPGARASDLSSGQGLADTEQDPLDEHEREKCILKFGAATRSLRP